MIIDDDLLIVLKSASSKMKTYGFENVKRVQKNFVT